MRILDLRGKKLSRNDYVQLVPRNHSNTEHVHQSVFDTFEQFHKDPLGTLKRQAQEFDGVTQYSVKVPEDHIIQALDELSPELREALETAISRVREVSQTQVPQSTVTKFGSKASIVQRWQPVERAGIYVPGGKAVYPSSVIMNTVPAQVAGVRDIALVSPPQAEYSGRIHPTILAAAGLLGITEIYAIGGAAAIASLAFGIDEIGLQPVNVITGPGNAYVAEAKKQVRAHVGIDSEAGPTEILIIADQTAQPRFVAADLISQAEHDDLASAVLVTDSTDLAEKVKDQLQLLTPQTQHASRVQKALSGAQSSIVLVDDVQQAAEFSNAYAPEHLEILTKEPSIVAESITNAGAIFLGHYSPVSLGDYLAGSNHVLPTMGHAMFSSGLGAHTFLRSQQIIEYDKTSLNSVSHLVQTLARDEILPAHAEAISVRFEDEEKE